MLRLRCSVWRPAPIELLYLDDTARGSGPDRTAVLNGSAVPEQLDDRGIRRSHDFASGIFVTQKARHHPGLSAAAVWRASPTEWELERIPRFLNAGATELL